MSKMTSVVWRASVVFMLACGVAACGGGKTAEGEVTSRSSTQASSEQGNGWTTASTLNAQELAAAEDAVLKGRSGASRPSAKAVSKRITVYRFFNTLTSAHFYTSSETERANIQASIPYFTFEGPAFYASGVSAAGLSPVHRFYNLQTGVHFYTISDEEKAYIQANFAQFQYEGVAYYASKVSGDGFTSLYRFNLTAKGFHFYSNSESETASIRASLPQYFYEGRAYYVMSVNWDKVSVLPHTGVTSAQCYRAGSDVLVACSSSEATALNSQQDGHRASINTMSYSLVPKAAGGSYDKTECVKDNVTGLIWEGKTAWQGQAASQRYGENLYSHYDDPTKEQVSSEWIEDPDSYGGWTELPPRKPTQEEVNSSDNSVGYINYVNSIALCGYSDWRLPSRMELMGLIDYGNNSSESMIKNEWFPNTGKEFGGYYFTSTSSAAIPEEPYKYIWTVSFSFGTLEGYGLRSTPYHIRLVRGNP